LWHAARCEAGAQGVAVDADELGQGEHGLVAGVGGSFVHSEPTLTAYVSHWWFTHATAPESAKSTRKPKNPVDAALTHLVRDEAITAAEKEEIVSIIDFRNFIGHQIENLLSDVGGTWAHRHEKYRPEGVRKYDGSAVKRLQHFRKRLDGLYRTHHCYSTLSFAPLAFEAAEKTYRLEIKRLQRKIDRLLEIRLAQIRKVNAELDLAGTGLKGDDAPDMPTMRHWTEATEGRLTKRGVETVYKLFDLGKSPMAVAHLTGLSLSAVRKRQKMWRARKGA
jgi:hypothetical protein